MSPSLSIVIPSHVRIDLLARCLKSVTESAPDGTQIIVVDDGSANGIVSNLALSYPGITAIRLRGRSGFCRAANAGIALATGDVVELLNDDARVSPGWAEAALRWFDDPKVAAVAPLVLQDDPLRERQSLPPLIDSAGDEYDPGGFARKRWHGQPWTTARGLAHPVWGASATAAFYRRSAVLEAGGFPADFEAYFEDVDLAFRLRRLGYAVWFDPDSLVWHRVSASYGRRPGRRVLELQSCNEERVFWRNIRGRARYRLIARHLAVLTGKALRRMHEGTLAPWLSGRMRAWIKVR